MPCLRTQRIVALSCTDTTPKPPSFNSRTQPSCCQVSAPTAFETVQNTGKDTVQTGTSYSNPIGPHRTRRPAASFKRPYQNCSERSLSNSRLHARGSPDRVLTFVGTNDQGRHQSALVGPSCARHLNLGYSFRAGVRDDRTRLGSPESAERLSPPRARAERRCRASRSRKP